VEEIAEEAGFSTGALYSNFAGKEELFLALFRHHTERRLADVEDVAAAGSASEAWSARTGQLFRAFTANEPDWPLLFYELWAYAARNPEVRPEWIAGRRRLRAAIAAALEDAAHDRGTALPAPAEELAVAVNALVNGIATERVTEPDAVPDDLVATAVAIFLRGLDAGSDRR
jgi:AcrR family transcriptional regulator